MNEKIWYAHKGADAEKLTKAQKILGFEFPKDFVKLYTKSDGFGMDIGYSYVHFWSIDSIISANSIFCKIKDGRYVFFADADDCIDSFAYEKATGGIWVFSTENDIDDGREAALNIVEMTEYIASI